MDSHLIARGLKRSSFKKFMLWIVPWTMVLLVGAYAIFLVLSKA